jgi:hypothetical protein
MLRSMVAPSQEALAQEPGSGAPLDSARKGRPLRQPRRTIGYHKGTYKSSDILQNRRTLATRDAAARLISPDGDRA